MNPKPDMRQARYIVTEGPNGDGKTSCSMLPPTGSSSMVDASVTVVS